MSEAAKYKSDETSAYRAVLGGDGAMHGDLISRIRRSVQFLGRALRFAIGMPMPLRTEDRRVLEQVILSAYAKRGDIRRVLFVGCDWYTSHYGRTFFRNIEFWTCDPIAKKRKFGTAGRHLIAGLEALHSHFTPGYFDLIICNGVYGYGLDDHDQCEQAFLHSFELLRDGGEFLFGWDDIPERTPVPLSTIASLRKFKPITFAPLATSSCLTDTPYRHRYDFLAK